MMRRFDAVICEKSDRLAMKQFRDYCDMTFISKSDSETTKEMVAEKLENFGTRCVEMEEMVKFQAR